ncbi:MAG: transglutaminase domain-containing protein [Desulfobacteraceae bacterium]|nr:transglutaminase domain-containing protein [Desulfobacteraceae bacterium]MBC2755597.1 transglutaminase domain-containing protein [Desulfobacteraceae bacterium]
MNPHLLRCRGIAVAHYGFTPGALNLRPLDVQTNSVKIIKKWCETIMKKIWWAAAGFALIFVILMLIRLDLWARFFPETSNTTAIAPGELPENDTWMNLYLKDKKIGYAHSVLTKQENGFLMDETLFMRMNIMGFSQDVQMTTTADLKKDLSLDTFVFKLHSGRFDFTASGQMKPGNKLSVTTNLTGTPKTNEIQLAHIPHLTGGVLHAAARDYKLSQKDQFTFHIFDPATMSQEPVTVKVIGEDEITSMGQPTKTTKLTLTFKGAVQTAWMDQNNEIVREKGLLGMTLEKTSREKALAGLSATASAPGMTPDMTPDITEIASVKSNVIINNPRKTSFLKVELSGIDTDALYLNGGRQTLSSNMLSVAKESMQDISKKTDKIHTSDLETFLRPEPFIESDHPTISELAAKIVSLDDPPPVKGQKLVDWVFKNIEKRPVISIPDAVTTLENRIGDCNEHSVLLAALARSAGIPSKIESGLLYLKGRFYYHAWNLLYVGEWITADSVFGLMPADAARIRFASGNPQSQLDLIPVIDRVGILVIEAGD